MNLNCFVFLLIIRFDLIQSKCLTYNETDSPLQIFNNIESSLIKIGSEKLTLLSPNHPDLYPYNQICAWTYEANIDMKIEIRIIEFNLEMSLPCYLDWLAIYDGKSINDTLILRLCGVHSLTQIETKENYVHFRFVTDNMNNFPGFNIILEAVYPEKLSVNYDESKYFKCRNEKIVDIKKKCDSNDDCGDGSDEECDQKSQEISFCTPGTIPDNSIVNLIVGGKISMKGPRPWMISMRDKDHICGATLIDNLWALTAAHCLTQVTNVSRLTLHFANDLDNGPVRYIEESFIVPDFLSKNSDRTPNAKDDDLALIKLNAPIAFNENITKICILAWEKFDQLPVNGTIVGWGTTLGSGSSINLNEATLPLIPGDECRQYYPPESGFFIDPERVICAGLDAGGVDSCKGDSGGPLTVELDGKWYQIGVIAGGDGCAEAGKPGIYTNLRYYLNWINSIITES